MNTLEKLRVIADKKDALAVPLIHSIEMDLGDFFELTTVAVCPHEEHASCVVQRKCGIVVALFTENPAELTASMVSVCARGLPSCTGLVILLEPHSKRRTLVLPNSSNIVRKPYREGDQLSLLILEALTDYYRRCEGGILNMRLPNNYPHIYKLIQQRSLQNAAV